MIVKGSTFKIEKKSLDKTSSAVGQATSLCFTAFIILWRIKFKISKVEKCIKPMGEILNSSFFEE